MRRGVIAVPALAMVVAGCGSAGGEASRPLPPISVESPDSSAASRPDGSPEQTTSPPVTTGSMDTAPTGEDRPISTTSPPMLESAETATPQPVEGEAPSGTQDVVPTTEAGAGVSRPASTPDATGAGILEVTAADLGASWRPGCPVPVDGLRLLQIRHLGFDGAVHTGRLVVHADWADELAGVFARLLAAEFPIERVEPIDAYEGSDPASMAANNTSAFNCRPVAGTGTWSEHAYGRAVDINPLVNPYVAGGLVDPPAGAAYVRRDPSVPGLIVDGDVVVRGFADIGWGWGGHWASARDYQHFSATGR